jgi:hypothetical protein
MNYRIYIVDAETGAVLDLIKSFYTASMASKECVRLNRANTDEDSHYIVCNN